MFQSDRNSVGRVKEVGDDIFTGGVDLEFIMFHDESDIFMLLCVNK